MVVPLLFYWGPPARYNIDVASPPAPSAPPRPSHTAHELLGSYLTSSHVQLTDPYRFAMLTVDPDTVDAPALDVDLDAEHKSGWAVNRLSSSSSEWGYDPHRGVNPSVVYTPQWAVNDTLTPVGAYRAIMEDDQCLVQWVKHGIICPALRAKYGAARGGDPTPRQAPSHMPPIDMVVTWANGSDPLHDQARQYWAYCVSSTAPARSEYCPEP